MLLKVRLTGNTRENIDRYKSVHFKPTDRITNGYIIGKAMNDIDEDKLIVTHKILENKNQSFSENYENKSTTISLRQEIYDLLEKNRNVLEKLTRRRIHMSQVIDIIMEIAATDYEKKIETYFIKKIGYDVKKYHSLIDDSMERIMHFFADEKIKDLEKKGQTDDVDYLYELLGWDKYDYFDTLFSFWNLFSYGLHRIKPDFYKITESKNIKMVYKKPYYYHERKLHYKSYPQLYSSNSSDSNTIELRKINFALREKYFGVDKLAEIAHSIACFIPVPDKCFNSAKGTSTAFDFLNLLVDLIEVCLENNKALEYGKSQNTKPKEVPLKVLKDWKKFLIDNREVFALEQEYYYDIEKNKLIGLPLFQKQSLEHPIPIFSGNPNEDEYKDCINEIINRSRNRGQKLALNICNNINSYKLNSI